MSAKNGGRGTPPVPPPGHEPPAEELEQIPITKEIVYRSQGTTCERLEKGGIVSFIVVEGGQPVHLHVRFGEAGKKALLEELAGGITLP